MFHKTLLLLTVLSFSPMIGSQQPQTCVDVQMSLWQQWANYLPSMTFSALIGGMTGGFSGHLFHELREYAKKNKDFEILLHLAAATSFLTEISVRNALINDMHKDLENNGVANNKNLMFTSAWVSSWIAFLKCAQL